MISPTRHPYDAFISSSPADAAWVHESLLPSLEAAGLRICLDTRDFEIGTPLLVNTERAFEQSRQTLLVLTPAWISSQWPVFEALLTQTTEPLARQQRLCALVLQPVVPPLRLAALRYIDLTSPAQRAAQLGRLIERLHSHNAAPQTGPTLGHLLPDRAVPQIERNRRTLLRKVRTFWIDDVLDKSLPHQALITLDLLACPAAVSRSTDALLHSHDQPDHALPSGTTALEVYDQQPGGLLILGAPGAGKTSVLLELARALLDRAAYDEAQPIPVVFVLASWSEQRPPLDVWLVDELNTRYDVPRRLAQTWLDAEQILPLLDGLDEVVQSQQAACVAAINAYRRAHPHLSLVVCSRSSDYSALAVRLQLQAAIAVQPLSRPQLERALTQLGPPLAGVRAALQADPSLWSMLDTPLMLHIVALTYAEQPVGTLAAHTTDRYQPLFAAYTSRMLARRGASHPYSAEQTIHWLAWLAWQMRQHSQTVFYIERMQPSWLPPPQRRLPTIGVALALGLLFGVVSGAITIWQDGIKIGLGWGLIEGLVVAAVFGYSQRISSVEALHWSWSSFRARLPLNLLIALSLGAALTWVYDLEGGLIGALLVLLLFGVVFGLARSEIELRVVPNQGMRRSLQHAAIVGLLVGSTIALIEGALIAPVDGMIDGLIASLIVGLHYGGRSCIQHLVLRRLLVRQNAAPWRYAQFLEYAASRIFLRRVGGGYIFIHRLLLEHFAAQYDRGQH